MYVCSRCNGLISTSRRKNHELYWCEELKRESDAVEEESEERSLKESPLDAKWNYKSGLQMTFSGPLCHSLLTYEFAHIDLKFEIEQQSLFGPLSTGAALWYSEIVMAEFMAANKDIDGFPFRCEHVKGTRVDMTTNKNKTVLELGCGTAPVAGLCALSLGYRVVFSDLQSILPSTRRNVELNAARIFDYRGFGSLCKETVDVLEYDWNKMIPERVSELSPLSLVICSDCLYRRELHESLAKVLQGLLKKDTLHKSGGSDEKDETVALISFQVRSDNKEEFLFFTESLPRVGLCAESINIKGILSSMKMPTKSKEGQYSSMGNAQGLYLYLVKASHEA
mmetsp:Transcript_9485/g.11790  ORF Transcript_9485/g.11790 Transcript_9485/m.11790 type:complete len:338 (+) Transcript_9485:162-1175(+)